MTKRELLEVQGMQIDIFTEDFTNDFISLTDIARYKNNDEPKDVVGNWLRNRNTIEFLGVWESLNNPNFKGVEFDAFKKEAGLNAFTLSPKKWIENTNAIGIISKPGRHGGTFAHTDIAFEFASWISPEFKLYIIKEYQRLKQDENSQLNQNWNLKRELAKVNYRLHTDSIKEHIIPTKLTEIDRKFVYANEADILNLALFGSTAREWKSKNPDLKGNMRDNATIAELLVLSNLESYNSIMISQGIPQSERLEKLNEEAIRQMENLRFNEQKALKNLMLEEKE